MLFSSRGAKVSPHAASKTLDIAAQRELAVGRFAFPVYLTAILFIITPTIDAFTNVWPPQMGSDTWRFGFVGAAANYLVSVVFGATLFCWTAAYYVQRNLLRIGMVFSLLLGMMLLAFLGDFLLGALSFKQLIEAPNMPAFKMSVGKASLKYTTAIGVLFFTAVSAYKAQQTYRAR